MSNNTLGAVNTYNDLRGHGLEGTEFKWVFKITPTYNNHMTVKILLKPVSKLSMFKRSHYTSEITVDMSSVDFVPTMKATLERILSVEHVKRVISDKEW